MIRDMTQVPDFSPGALESIGQRYPLSLVVLFGSRARASAHAGSDLDIGIQSQRSLSAAQRRRLWGELCAVFECEVDMTLLDHPSPLLAYQIARDGILLFERSAGAWEKWKSYAIRHYWDTAKFRDDLQQHLNQQAERLRHAASG
jgi:predicted nucleotidyltransferase